MISSHDPHSPQDIQIETFPIGPLGCNCSLIYSQSTKEALVVDPGQDSQALMKELEQRGLQVKLLLHTHAHFDHIAGSSEIGEKTGAKLCLHQEDMFLYEGLQQQGAWFGFSLPTPGTIQIKLEDEQDFGLTHGLTQSTDLIKVIHTPGHTPGSCSFYTEALGTPVLFSGDTLFRRSIGRTDLPGGDFPTIIKSIKERLFPLPSETVVIPGHGPQSRLFEEKKENPFMR